MQLSVFSEISPLKKVLLHRPGPELEQLTPQRLDKLLFDDIPYLLGAQKEHDIFAETLRKNGVSVVYLKDLMAQTLDVSEEIKKSFIRDFIHLSGPVALHFEKETYQYLMGIEKSSDIVEKTMTGLLESELPLKGRSGFAQKINRESRFVLDPSPNLYFTRDPFAVVGKGVSFSRMFSFARQRETLYGKYIMQHHPDFAGNVPAYYESTLPFSIEGGDILNIGNGVLAVGVSQRTEPEAIEILAKRLLSAEDSGYQSILALSIPNLRAYMHLDTVFTQVDEACFTVHPGILHSLKCYRISLSKNGRVLFKELSASLDKVLAKEMKKDKVSLIYCGGQDAVAAEREQWNDGSNTLCIAPGKIIVYDRNTITNHIFRENGISTIEIPSSELARGRGGPRCMSMPLVRA